MSFILSMIVVVVAPVVLLLLVFLGCRNQAVYRVRIAFIDDKSLYDAGAYSELPSYDDMLYNPRYWSRWTKQQWVEANA